MFLGHPASCFGSKDLPAQCGPNSELDSNQLDTAHSATQKNKQPFNVRITYHFILWTYCAYRRTCGVAVRT